MSSTAKQRSLEWILQIDHKEAAERRFIRGGWMTAVLYEPDTHLSNGGIWSELIPLASANNDMRTAFRTRPPFEFRPACSTEDEKVNYHLFGNDEGVESLVIRRSFHGIRKNTFEILEEFRLFHNLFHDVTSGTFLKIRENGDEDPIVRVTSDHVQIRVRELREFLSIKEMCAVIGFDFIRYSPQARMSSLGNNPRRG